MVLQCIPKLAVRVAAAILAAVFGGILPPRLSGQDARRYGRQRCLPLPPTCGCTFGADAGQFALSLALWPPYFAVTLAAGHAGVAKWQTHRT